MTQPASSVQDDEKILDSNIALSVELWLKSEFGSQRCYLNPQNWKFFVREEENVSK